MSICKEIKTYREMKISDIKDLHTKDGHIASIQNHKQ